MDIISTSENGKLSFGNYELPEKQKKEDFPHCGDLYKIKTYNTMTKLEKNGLFFKVESDKDSQITVGLEENTEYDISIDGKSIGKMKSNGSGKVSFSVELSKGEIKDIKIVK